MRAFNIIGIVFLLSCVGRAQIISTIAGTGTGGYSGDGGPATLAQLNVPVFTIFDSVGNLFIADASTIRKVSPTGIISTVCGNGTAGFSGDGGSALSAQLSAPVGIAFDGSGNMFIADQQNNRIRKIDKNGIITTIAGTGALGFSGDGGPATAAKLYTPGGIVIDKNKNLYFTDMGNYRIRKIDSTGIISTYAGTGTIGYTGDGGPAISAQLNSPYGISITSNGDIYFGDCGSNVVRKIDPSGVITTVAGNGTAGYSGDGGLATVATFSFSISVVRDRNGEVYIADMYNQVIRKVDYTGIITTIAGTGTPGYSGDGGLATAVRLNYPFGVTVDSCCLYIAESSNNVIRKVSNIVGVPEQSNANRLVIQIFPNPNNGSFSISYNGKGKQLIASVYNVYGEEIQSKTFNVENKEPIQIQNLPDGVYIIKLFDGTKVLSAKRIIVTK